MGSTREMCGEYSSSLFDGNPDAIAFYDMAGACVRANAAAEELTGFSDAELRGTTFTGTFVPADTDGAAIAFGRAQSGTIEHVQTSIRRKDGILMPIECHIFPARHDGRVVGVYVQARDIVGLAAAEDSLALNQERFRSLFEYHPDAIVALRVDGRITRVNVALEGATGFFGEQVIGSPWTDLLAPEQRDAASSALRAVQRGEATEFDAELLDRLGNRIEVQIKLVPVRVGERVEGACAIAKNVEARRSAERAIERQHARIRELYLAVASRSETIDGEIQRVLQLGCRLFGFDYGYVTRLRDEVLEIVEAAGNSSVAKGSAFPRNASFSRHLHGERGTVFIADLDEEPWRNDPARATAPWRSYFAAKLSVNGEAFGTLVFAGTLPRDSDLEEVDRDLIQLMALFVAGALERSAHAERIEQLAFFDTLTGLPNRVLFGDRIRQTLATARRYSRGFAVMYVDLDNFKDVNDTFGHAAGDRVLKAVADRLMLTLRESDTIARFGGDEFVVLQPVVNGPADAADLGRKIVEAMQTDTLIGGETHPVRVTVGIALYPEDATTMEALMDCADSALYRAKRAGRNRWMFYNDESLLRQWPGLTRRTDSAETAG